METHSTLQTKGIFLFFQSWWRKAKVLHLSASFKYKLVQIILSQTEVKVKSVSYIDFSLSRFFSFRNDSRQVEISFYIIAWFKR